MRLRSMAVAAAGMVIASALLAGCRSTNTTTSDRPTGGTTPISSAPATPAVKDLTPGNCTTYPKASAVKLLGGVTSGNKALDIGTDGGTKIDVCSYLDITGLTNLQGVSYAVVRYDSATTAYAEAQKVRTEMLGSAAEHDWAVQSLTKPVPGAGPLLGGYGTKTESGVTYTIAVVGTNVGPYLVTALGASTESASNAKTFALTLFEALAAAVE
jgi:hypothetical protein